MWVFLENVRIKAAQSINTIFVETYWEIGKYIKVVK
jgi:hypothetical protein